MSRKTPIGARVQIQPELSFLQFLLYMTLHGSADIQGKVIGPGTTFKNPKIFYTMFVRRRRR
jgi:hypothetical protein